VPVISAILIIVVVLAVCLAGLSVALRGYFCAIRHRYKEPAHEHNRALTSPTITPGASEISQNATVLRPENSR
jgi:hypothetical protein